MEQQHTAIKLKDITKQFGKVAANDRVCLSVEKGEILLTPGENSSGKTTLMNTLSGTYYPGDGQIFVNGTEVTIAPPKDSLTLGTDMIHQHFKLVDVPIAVENIILGLPGKEVLDTQSVSAKIQELMDRYGFGLNPDEKIYNVSMSQKRTVETTKVLYRGVNVPISDEPTAVSTPRETEKLFAVLRNIRADGRSIIIIVHKLHGILVLSGRVSVLREGQYISTMNTCEATVGSLTETIVGEKVNLSIGKLESANPAKRLEVRGLGCMNKEGFATLKDISFAASNGEILGIVEIAGSDQKEPLEAIAGPLSLHGGGVVHYLPEGGEELLSKELAADIRKLGMKLSSVPEGHLGMGLVGSIDMADNMMLRGYDEGRGLFANRKRPKQSAERIIEEPEVVTLGVTAPVQRLSGRNAQKVLVGREISSNLTALMMAYLVRGLDINSSYAIYGLLNEQKKQDVVALYMGEDLDVLLELCDRILVLYGGQISGIVDGGTVIRGEVGLLMTKMGEEQEHE